MTETISKGKVVSITYTIRDEQDDIKEAVEVPVDYLHGGNTGPFPKIEAALEGKAVGDVVSVALEPKEGFGERDPNLGFTDRIENVPPEFRQVGAEAEFYNEAGETIKMRVVHVDSGTVTLDGNHPFAGKTMTFRVEVRAIRPASPEELRAGEVGLGAAAMEQGLKVH